MPRMIQIRNVPDELHRRLKVKAAAEGLSLSDLLLREARRLAEKPSLDEIMARLRQRSPVKLRVSSVRIIRAAREGR
jgi:plasmid stability protein